MHWNEPRSLTIEELKKIQSFSDDYILIGNYRNQYERIGNSVPPLFMEAIARHIKENILQRLADMGLEPYLMDED